MVHGGVVGDHPIVPVRYRPQRPAFGLVERSRFVGILARNHGLILMVWVLTLIALIVIRWDEYFSTLY